MPTTKKHDPPEVTNARDNIRLLKTHRRVNDQHLADGAGFNSRQMVADRIGGRTPISIEDLVAFAGVLGVAPAILLCSQVELWEWIAQNPDYEAPRKAPPRKRAAK